MSKKYRSDAMAAIHETMAALHGTGAIDKQTMRRFDEACLTPIRPLRPGEIKAIREREQVSQAVFATYLNVTSSLDSKWERGEKKLSGPRSSCFRWWRRTAWLPLRELIPGVSSLLTAIGTRGIDGLLVWKASPTKL